MAHIGDSPITIVRQALHQHGNTINAVTFVGDFLIVFRIAAPCPALDRFVDRISPHVGAERLVDGRA